MLAVPKTAFTRMPLEEVVKNLPLALTHEGELIGYLVRPDDVIIVSDLHPRVQIQLRQKEALARQGMPPRYTFLTRDEVERLKKEAEGENGLHL